VMDVELGLRESADEQFELGGGRTGRLGGHALTEQP
jgi:hypothetical protein